MAQAWRGFPYPMEDEVGGAAPSAGVTPDPYKTFEQFLDDELAREEAFAQQAAAGPGGSTEPASAAPPPASSSDVFEVDRDIASPELMARIRSARRSMGKKGVRQAGGFIDVPREGGGTDRFDTYGPQVRQGFEPSRGMPRWFNAIRYGLESSRSPGQLAQNREYRERERFQRAQLGQREREFEAEQEYRNRSLDMDRERIGLEKHGQRIGALARAHARAAESFERQETAKANAEWRGEYKKLMQAGKPLDPLEQQRFEWLEGLKGNNRELYDLVMAGDVAGKAVADVLSGAGENKPPTVDVARKYEEEIGNRLAEIEENLSALDMEIGGAGVFNRAGNEAVPIARGGQAYTVPAAGLGKAKKDLEAERMFLMDQQARVRRFLTTGEWNPQSVATGTGPYAGLTLEDAFAKQYDELHAGKGGAAVPGLGSQPLPEHEQRKNARGESVFDRMPGSGAGAPVAPDRPPIPPPDVLKRMDYVQQLFYQLLSEDPNLTTEAAKRLVRQIMRNKVPPSQQNQMPGTARE